jgi:hypothetical protein
VLDASAAAGGAGRGEALRERLRAEEAAKRATAKSRAATCSYMDGGQGVLGCGCGDDG